MIAIGGGIGVEDTAAMMQKMNKPVLPLNFHIAGQPDDAGTPKLHAESIRNPKSFMPKSHSELVSKVDSLDVFDEESAQRVSKRIIELMCVELKGSVGRRILNAAETHNCIHREVGRGWVYPGDSFQESSDAQSVSSVGSRFMKFNDRFAKLLRDHINITDNQLDDLDTHVEALTSYAQQQHGQSNSLGKTRILCTANNHSASETSQMSSTPTSS